MRHRNKKLPGRSTIICSAPVHIQFSLYILTSPSSGQVLSGLCITFKHSWSFREFNGCCLYVNVMPCKVSWVLWMWWWLIAESRIHFQKDIVIGNHSHILMPCFYSYLLWVSVSVKKFWKHYVPSAYVTAQLHNV